MAVFNSLQFDNINSLDYGIYITGEAVYNSPERDVEVVSVPGRNGDILIDNGRYNNIEVTYRAGCFGANQDEFAQKIKAFRAVLASKKGYQRITDTYNPNEYRMGTFIKPIEVSKESYDRVGEFDIIFNCKPQRFLTSGETQISVNSGAKINNPTLFDAKPLVMVHGYGTINIGDYEIELDDGSYGTITITYGDSESAGSASNTRTMTMTKSYASYAGMVNTGDPLYMERANTVGGVYRKSGAPRISTVDGVAPPSDLKYNWSVNILEHTFTAFPSQDEVATNTTTHAFVLSNNTSFNSTITLTVTNKPTGVIEFTSTLTTTVDISANFTYGITNLSTDTITLESSISTVGDPTYIDCDIGEAYLIDGSGNVVSLNSLIELGSDLPVLSPGDTTITYDNTITAVEIVPHWWIL